MITKICTHCKNEKSLDNFFQRKTKKKSYRSECKSCGTLITRKDREENPDKYFNYHLIKKFNITIDIYNKMIEEQKGCCKICQGQTSFDDRRLYVDHCHKTGRVRGLLCHNCNIGLGCFKDKYELLKIASDYLEEFENVG